MIDWQQISDMQIRISMARVHAPADILTKTALVLMKGISLVLLIFIPVEMLTTTLGGCVVALTFGLLLLVFSIIWLPFLGFLLSTSWLWLHAWYLRPILIIPGILVAAIANLFVMLIPDPDRNSKNTKLSICGEWPLSWYLIKPPV